MQVQYQEDTAVVFMLMVEQYLEDVNIKRVEIILLFLEVILTALREIVQQ